MQIPFLYFEIQTNIKVVVLILYFCMLGIQRIKI